jgi:hypothetical protein
MNRDEAIAAHAARLRNLTDIQVRNLMEHAANKTPLMPTDEMHQDYINESGEC